MVSSFNLAAELCRTPSVPIILFGNAQIVVKATNDETGDVIDVAGSLSVGPFGLFRPEDDLPVSPGLGRNGSPARRAVGASPVSHGFHTRGTVDGSASAFRGSSGPEGRWRLASQPRVSYPWSFSPQPHASVDRTAPDQILS